MPLLKRPVFDKDLTPRQRNAALALEKAAAKLAGLNTTSLKNIKAMFEDCGSADANVETEKCIDAILDYLIDEKGLR